MSLPTLPSLEDNPTLSKLNNINQWILAIILILSGFIVCFFGGKYAKKLLFIVTFCLGSLACYLLMNNWFDTDIRVHLLVSCGVGIVIGFICVMVYRICIFTTGAIGGVIIAQGIWNFVQIHWDIDSINHSEIYNTVFIIIVAIICGLIAFKFVDIVLRGLTAFIGAFMVTIGIAYFVQVWILYHSTYYTPYTILYTFHIISNMN